MNYTEEEINKLRASFRKRRAVRISIFILILFILVSVTALAFPSWELFGLPRLAWAPFFYIVMFALIAGIAFVWRCPACHGLLGDVFNTKFCSKCGFKFYD
jgi:hypothetical protein